MTSTIVRELKGEGGGQVHWFTGYGRKFVGAVGGGGGVGRLVKTDVVVVDTICACCSSCAKARRRRETGCVALCSWGEDLSAAVIRQKSSPTLVQMCFEMLRI